MKFALLLAAAAAFAEESKDQTRPQYDIDWHDAKIEAEALEIATPEVSEHCTGGMERDCKLKIKFDDKHHLAIHTRRTKVQHSVTQKDMHMLDLLVEGNGHPMYIRKESPQTPAKWYDIEGKGYSVTKEAMKTLGPKARAAVSEFPSHEASHLGKMLNSVLFNEAEMGDVECRIGDTAYSQLKGWRNMYSVHKKVAFDIAFDHAGVRNIRACFGNFGISDVQTKEDDMESEMPWAFEDEDEEEESEELEESEGLRIQRRRRRRRRGEADPIVGHAEELNNCDSDDHTNYVIPFVVEDACNNGGCAGDDGMSHYCSGTSNAIRAGRRRYSVHSGNWDDLQGIVIDGGCGGTWGIAGEVCNDWADREIDALGSNAGENSGRRRTAGPTAGGSFGRRRRRGGLLCKEGTSTLSAPKCYINDDAYWDSQRRRGSTSATFTVVDRRRGRRRYEFASNYNSAGDYSRRRWYTYEDGRRRSSGGSIGKVGTGDMCMDTTALAGLSFSEEGSNNDPDSNGESYTA